MAGSTLDLIMLWVSTVAQCLFVLLWATQPWWVTKVGRVMMAKSAVLAALFLASLWQHYFGLLPVWAGRLMFYSLTIAIVGQLLVIAREIWQARHQHRAVSGTNGNSRPH